MQNKMTAAGIPTSNEDNNKNKPIAEREDTYIMALHDICARIDLVVSEMMNVITNLNNTKNYYLKMVGQLRQERDSISSK
jgi:hypothetical protein